MKKMKINIDWVGVMAADDDEEQEELEVIVKDKAPPPPPEPKIFPASSADDHTDCEQSLTDRQLDELLERHNKHLRTMGPRLPDKGMKFQVLIERLKDEKQRRMLRRPEMDVDGCQKLMHSTSSGSSDVSRQENMGSKNISRSTFSDFFNRKQETDTQSVKPFGKELQDLGHQSWKNKGNGTRLASQSNGRRSLSGKNQLQRSGKRSSMGYQESRTNYQSKGSSPYSLLDNDDSPREGNVQESPSQGSRRRLRQKSDKTVINLDEEEPPPSIGEMLAAELPEGTMEDIYYPSRDDQDVVNVCVKDMECLAPQGYLTSPIMNFYIRYLQHETSSENQTFAECHFFNTYFYKKLKEAVSYKGNDRDTFFVKFRRWWKGTDLFRKGYIFIPIHENVHWSLVIICIPDKEDDSGLIILHLDSLGFHSGRSIFDNIKRFLREEWNYLNQDLSSSDLPISERIWRHLPRRIGEAEIEVPQQKNDYDCGLFVLFFMKQFIGVAPPRLKKKDLQMFNKKWFRPEEASALRNEILGILVNLFRVVNQTDQILD